MYKNSAIKQQFLTRTGNFSTFGMRDGQALIEVAAREQLSREEKREALSLALRGVQEQLIALNQTLKARLPYKEAKRLELEREALKERYQSITGELSELKKLARGKENVGHFIIEVMRERLTKPEWELVVAEAHRRHAMQQNVDETK